MDQASMLYLILLLPCLLLSAFFSGSEAAFLSLRKVRIRHLVESRIAGAKRVARMVDQPEKVLPTILLGNNLVNTAFAALTTVIMISLVGEGRGIIVATVASTVTLLVLGETLPKTVAIRHSEPLFFFSARVLEWLDRLLLPLVVLLHWVNRMLVMRLGSDSRVLFTEEEIKVAISIGMETGAVEEQEAQMLEKVFRFGDRQLREVMTPRTEVVWVEAGTTLKEFLAIYQGHSHTRFPVFEGNAENVAGALSVKDVLVAVAREEISDDDSVTDLIRPVDFVPDTKPVGTLFREMQKVGSQMAMAVDEFGGIAGLMTLKQLIEEVVGPVGEEGMEPEMEYVTIDENTFHIDGGMQIEEANEELDLDLPEGDYETVAGFILEALGHIPTEGEHFRHNGLRLEVSQMRGVRVEKVIVTKGHITPGG
ncbi:MAG: hemolysin family protein [Dehalococcoidia bacterium]|nr:hemolysin family protein [Dehalococcoidia bacterium]